MSPESRLPERANLARHRDLVEAATEIARQDERVLAAWLVGSLAAEYADEFSDIDFHIAVVPEHFTSFGDEGWVQFITRFTPIVAARPFGSGMGGYAITPDWMHFDLAIHRAGDQFLRPGAGFRPLFDRDGDLLPPGPVIQSIGRGSPYFPADVVQWFFYMLGNLAVVVGRDEPVLGMNGAVMLCYTCLVPLLHAEQGVVRTGGNKRMREFLTEEQHDLLRALPPIEATLRSVVESYAATAEVFVSRGRALATKTGGVWPEEFEAATRRHLERSIGTPIPRTGR
jgi:hypothetical protein